ncbi:NUDIX domain-containing protein [Nocardioides acrostichi]|uniref:NUDIX domain-containing protein n=1 Tax=Nocardioides acrostichi TaxID=2784339 RepID=A0A930UZ14_9ACTN|nr:NUDIX domain-containing protein [Nocardioides acrostichi]MBF4161009.1 NUDIX domain-containing protein [Nocardioides acrostichi]
MHRFGCVVLVDRRGRLLLQERDEHPAIDPEKWGLCGGHLESGEDPLAGTVRELAEETGVHLAPEHLHLVEERPVFHEAYDSWDRLWFYAAATDLTDADIVCGEGRQIVFVPHDRVLDLSLTGSAGLILPDFLASDLYHRLQHTEERS